MPDTILVTGASGYIAKHIVAGLLNAGYAVTGSARSTWRDAEIRAALRPALDDPTDLDRYRTVALDLSADDGWDAAMEGAAAVMHTASPFPLVQPKDAAEVIRPAVDGTNRALEAARRAGVARVILTSSSGAVTARAAPGNGTAFTEEDWSDPESPYATPYFRSKTEAERAAWAFAERHPGMQLTVLNPGFVLGPPLDSAFGTSIRVMARLLSGKDPMLPRVGFPTVDVRDVAEGHIRALKRPDTIGHRVLLSDRFLWFADLARAADKAVPHRRIVTREAPDAVIRLLALFDREIRTITPILGRQEQVDSTKARSLLGLNFRDASRAAGDTARWLDAQR